MRLYADAAALGAIYWPAADSRAVAEFASRLTGPFHTSELAAAQLEFFLWHKLASEPERVRAAEAHFREDAAAGRVEVRSMGNWDDAWQFVREWNRGRLSLALPITHLVHPALAALNLATDYLSAHPAARAQARAFRLAVHPARLTA
jgi:hypothetical protein